MISVYNMHDELRHSQVDAGAPGTDAHETTLPWYSRCFMNHMWDIGPTLASNKHATCRVAETSKSQPSVAKVVPTFFCDFSGSCLRRRNDDLGCLIRHDAQFHVVCTANSTRGFHRGADLCRRISTLKSAWRIHCDVINGQVMMTTTVKKP